MSGSFGTGRRSTGARPESGIGLVDGVRQVVERLRPDAAAPVDDVVDVRAELLTLLAARSATGSELVQALAGSGMRPPGAGAVYPMLSLLADEGLVTAEEADGRKRWSLTDTGRVAADSMRATDGRPAGPRVPHRRRAGRGGLARAALELAQTAALVGQTGTKDQVADAIDLLDGTRRRLLAILTRD